MYNIWNSIIKTLIEFFLKYGHPNFVRKTSSCRHNLLLVNKFRKYLQ